MPQRASPGGRALSGGRNGVGGAGGAGVAAGDRWMCRLPISHVSGLQVLVRSWVTGNEPLFSGEAAAGGDGCFVSLVPTQLGRLVSARTDLSPFKAILLGGAAASDELVEA